MDIFGYGGYIMDSINVSLQILITGFLVVFSMLLLLIGIIKLYGFIVYSVQNKNKKKEEKELVDTTPVEINNEEITPESSDDEIIAVISAAVYSMYGSKNVRVKSIKKSSGKKNAWRNAGVINNTSPF